MNERDKLLEAASKLGFEATEELPEILGLPADQTCQCWSKGSEDDRTLYVGKPSQVQCAAMRAVLYFWKVLRLVEAAVTEDENLDSTLILRFEDLDVPIKLPDEMRGGAVTPVRVVGNLILGKLNDDAFATRGTMGQEEEVTQRKQFSMDE